MRPPDEVFPIPPAVEPIEIRFNDWRIARNLPTVVPIVVGHIGLEVVCVPRRRRVGRERDLGVGVAVTGGLRRVYVEVAWRRWGQGNH